MAAKAALHALGSGVAVPRAVLRTSPANDPLRHFMKQLSEPSRPDLQPHGVRQRLRRLFGVGLLAFRAVNPLPALDHLVI